jgi:hypothetical protein
MRATHRRKFFGLSVMAALGLALLPSGASAQQKPLKDLLVGSWTLLLVDEVKADGSQMPDFGPNPLGTLIFTADGHYSLQIMRAGRPKFVSNSPAQGTPDEMKADLQGMISHFGAYTASDADKTVTFRIEGSSFPNWEGTKQTRSITAITNEVLTYTFRPPGGIAEIDHAELAWKRTK